jgi:hypothetical protein
MSTLPRSRLAGCVLAAACALLLPSAGRAGYLSFSLNSSGPTIDSAWPPGTLKYDAGTGNFHSDSLPLTLTRFDASANLTLYGQFTSGNVSIDLFVDKMGNFVSNGTGFVLTGTVDFLDPTTLDPTKPIGSASGDAGNPLLFGPITNFGFLQVGTPAGNPPVLFNGLFTMQGGVLTKPVTINGTPTTIYNPGTQGGFILTAETTLSGTPGDFTKSFSADLGKDVEGAVVPAPPAGVLALICAGLLLGRAVFRRRKSLAA